MGRPVRLWAGRQHSLVSKSGLASLVRPGGRRRCCGSRGVSALPTSPSAGLSPIRQGHPGRRRIGPVRRVGGGGSLTHTSLPWGARSPQLALRDGCGSAERAAGSPTKQAPCGRNGFQEASMQPPDEPADDRRGEGKPECSRHFGSGRYWARTSDLLLVRQEIKGSLPCKTH
jgi:hypothetical protein